MITTALEASLFMQAVGNNGVMCAPAMRVGRRAGYRSATRTVDEATAQKLGWFAAEISAEMAAFVIGQRQRYFLGGGGGACSLEGGTMFFRRR